MLGSTMVVDVDDNIGGDENPRFKCYGMCFLMLWNQ